MKRRFFGIAALTLLYSGTAKATVVDVDSHCNIFGAGLGSAASVVGDGLSPISTSFAAAPNQVLTFSSVTGVVNFYGFTKPSTEGPDGYGPSFQPYAPGQYPTSPANFPGFMGLSGLRDANNGAYLVGVFLTDASPAQPAPPTTDFSNNKSFLSLSPQIAQLFYIGDGRTGTGAGATQQFYVPPDATRLFMGFIDSQFSDNFGSLPAAFQISTVPEPSTLVLLAVGAASLLNCRRRK